MEDFGVQGTRPLHPVMANAYTYVCRYRNEINCKTACEREFVYFDSQAVFYFIPILSMQAHEMRLL